jgi:hypothetical protein
MIQYIVHMHSNPYKKNTIFCVKKTQFLSKLYFYSVKRYSHELEEEQKELKQLMFLKRRTILF